MEEAETLGTLAQWPAREELRHVGTCEPRGLELWWAFPRPLGVVP